MIIQIIKIVFKKPIMNIINVDIHKIIRKWLANIIKGNKTSKHIKCTFLVKLFKISFEDVFK